MSVNSKMTALADEIRELSGTTSAMGLDAMASTLNTENANFASNLSTQDDLISQIMLAVNELPEAGNDSEPVLQEKTVTPTTSTQTVKPDSGYDGLSQITVAAIPSTYVKPTTTKAATTYTPTTSNQTIAAGTYCSGVQTIKGDANLVADNIKSGVSIFGVAGSYESSGIQYEIVTIPAGSNSVAYTLPRVTHAVGSANLEMGSVTDRNYENFVSGIRNNDAYRAADFASGIVMSSIDFDTTPVTYSNGTLTIPRVSDGVMFDVMVLLVNDPTASQISLPS